VLATLATCAARVPSVPPEVPEIRPGILQGYLPVESMPNSLTLLPPPPAPGSAADALDLAVSEASLALDGSERWVLAQQDNDLSFPAAAGTFSCALGVPVSETETPYLYRVLRRTLADTGLATYGAKNQYARKRPFLLNGAAVCVTDEEKSHLVDDGSYPSGHTAVGWAWGLILAELAPDQADDIFARGWAFGQSRVICNVHWQSDVLMGRSVGAAAVANLHATEAFRSDLAIAKRELDAVRQRGLPPSRDCAAEARALAEMASDAPWPAGR
jgi:acid phosphatase (class A)